MERAFVVGVYAAVFIVVVVFAIWLVQKLLGA